MEKKNYKYIILDFGNVVVTPTSGDWNITPKFLELVDTSKIDESVLKETVNKYGYMLGEKLLTLEEELDMFTRYYTNILKDIKYPRYKSIAKEIAYDRTYNDSKYTVCEDIYNELSNLKKEYTLLMLTDNWPCVLPYMKDKKLDIYFDKIYVSSIYNALKKDGVFFDYLINDYNIKPGDALFIDDIEANLDVAIKKGIDVMLMDRYKSDITSKYKIINDLYF